MKYEKINLQAGLEGKIWSMAKKSHVNIEGHVHLELECNLVISGQAEYIIQGQRYQLNRGTLIWLFPDQKHLLINVSENFSMYIGVFQPVFLKRLVDQGADEQLIAMDYAESGIRQISEDHLKLLIDSFEELMGQWYSVNYYNIFLAHICLKVWHVFLGTIDESDSDMVPPAIEKCLHLLEDVTNLMTLENISTSVGYSASQLSRLFKKHIGISLVVYRQKKRLDYFENAMLQDVSKSMMTVALEAGFGSYAQFHRIFKKNYGYGPAEYLRRLRSSN